VCDTILIIGIGRTGLSCARFLAAQKQSFAVLDNRLNPPLLAQFKKEFPDISITLGDFNETQLKQAKKIILVPGLSRHQALFKEVDDKIIGDIELFMQETRDLACQIVLITGSNGKSTATTLLLEMAQKAGIKAVAGGNLGEPALDLLSQKADLYILELSSFQLETTPNIHSTAATVLNISPDHMDRYQDFTHYAQTKQHIYQNTLNSIVNLDDIESQKNSQGTVIGFSLDPEFNQGWHLQITKGQEFIAYQQQNKLATNELQMMGQHNIANVLACLNLAQSLNLPEESLIAAIKDYKGLTHRTERVPSPHSIMWINDSKATNVGACVAAINGLGSKVKQNIVLIAGGQSKGADFSELLQPVLQFVHHVILFGEDREKIRQVLLDKCGLIMVNTLDEAVNHASEIAEKDDIVLFSPACASFDLFKNFEHRGDCFKQAVTRLPR